MGEYATYNGHEIKIGTCENMYYIRYEDRFKVQPLENSLDCSSEMGLRWRLPFPDEDCVEPGEYTKHDRGIILGGFSDPTTTEDDAVGIIQLHHPSGILINLPCYHGEKLPEIQGKDVKIFWNGKAPAYALTAVKNTTEGIFPIVSCQFCRTSWRYDWNDVLPFVHDTELKHRLIASYVKNRIEILK